MIYIHNNLPCLHWHVSEIRVGEIKNHLKNITWPFTQTSE